MATKKLKLEDLKLKSFTTGKQVGGGPGPGSLLCSYGACSEATYCIIIGDTNGMYQCIEDGCGY